jgi:hypothetical protein
MKALRYVRLSRLASKESVYRKIIFHCLVGAPANHKSKALTDPTDLLFLSLYEAPEETPAVGTSDCSARFSLPWDLLNHDRIHAFYATMTWRFQSIAIWGIEKV